MNHENKFDYETLWKTYFFGNIDVVDIDDLFKKHNDLREIPELVNSLLEFLHRYVIDIEISDEILDRFANYCQKLPFIQTEKLLAYLVSAINEIGVNNGPTNLKIIAEFLLRILMNMRISEHNFVPIKKLMEQFSKQSLAPLMELCLIQSQDESIFKTVLALSYVWGELSLVFQQYLDVNIGDGSIQTHAYNLNILHDYFDKWKIIYSNIKENGNNSCYYLFAVLVLQKFRFVKLTHYRTGVNDVSTKCLQNCVRFLYKSATKSFAIESGTQENIWLMFLNNLPLLSEYLDQEMIEPIIRQIMELCTAQNNSELKEEMYRIIKSETYIEISYFQSTFISVIWEKIFHASASSVSIFEKLSRIPQDNAAAQLECVTEISKELNIDLSRNDYANIDFDVVNRYLQILGMLRHEYLSPVDKIRCVLGIFTLLSKLDITVENASNVLRLVSQCYHVLNTALIDCEHITNYISSGLIYTWFLKFHLKLCQPEIVGKSIENQMRSFEKIFSSLVINTIHSEKSLNEITSFVTEKITKRKIRKLPEVDARLYLTATNIVLKSLIEISARKDLQTTCGQLKESFLENLISMLDEERLFPYLTNSIALIIKTKYYKECADQCYNIIAKSLSTLHDCQNTEHILTELEVVTSFVAEMPQIQQDTWTKIKTLYQIHALTEQNDCVDRLNDIFANFVRCVDESQFKNICDDLLLGIMINEVTAETTKQIICCVNLLEVVLNNSQQYTKDKLDITQAITNDLLIAILHLIHKPSDDLRWVVVGPATTLVEKIIQNSSARLQCRQVGICLHICTSVLNFTRIRFAPQEFSRIFNALCSILSGVLRCQLSVVLTTFITLIPCFNGMISFLSEYGDQSQIKSVERELSYIQECAQNLCRLFLRFSELNKFSHAQSDIEKLSPFIVAEYIMSSQQFTLLPSVKDILVNGIYRIMDLCDAHGITLLQTNLPPSGKEVFKYFLLNYKTMHKYTGRV